MSKARTAYTAHQGSAEAARALIEQLGGETARAIVFFAGIKQDGRHLGDALSASFPGACVLGCSTDGEFSDRGFGKGGASAIAFGPDMIGQCAVEMVNTSGDLSAAMAKASRGFASRLGHAPREVDPARYVALALVEGAKGREERINEALGDMAPFLPFVGGSAGDDVTFSSTWAYGDGQYLEDGTALMIAEMGVPFRILKTCSAEPMEATVTVTKCEPSKRLILELNGEPAAEHYAKLLGKGADELGISDFVRHPFGLMIDGEPWIRSVLKPLGSGLMMACAVVQGAELHMMKTADIIADTRLAIAEESEKLGGAISGAILFSCAYRMLELSIDGKERAYHDVLSEIRHAGMHTNGESYLGHINHTLTGILFG